MTAQKPQKEKHVLKPKKRNMLRTLILFFAMTLATMSMAADDRYDSLMKAAVGKPSVQILEDAEKAAKQKDERKALVLYMVVCNRSRTATREQDKTSCALAYLRSGDIYYWRGHYAKALSLYLQGHKICESTEEKRKIIEFYKCFGNVYCMFKEYAQAVKYYERGYELRNQYPDPVITYRLLNNLCHTFYLMGDANNATRYYRLAQQLSKHMPERQRPDFKFYSSFYLAIINKMNHRYDQAIALLRPLVPFAQEKHLPPRYICGAYQEIYKIFDLKGDIDSTRRYVDLCLTTAEKTRQMHMFTETLGEMSKIYARRGDKKNADLYSRRYRAAADSTFNQDEFNKAKTQQFVYEMDKVDKDIAALTAENDSRQETIRLQGYMLCGGLALLVVVSVLLFMVYRQKQRLKHSYNDLYAINQRLLDMQQQLDEAKSAMKYKSSNLADDRKQDLIKAIAHIMDSTLEYADPEFSLERLASLTGSNSKYVSQAINDGYGKNFSNFVNEYRIRLACRRLTDDEHFGNLTIRSIGASVGYKSNTSFVGCFRKITGMTPSEYQRTAREESEECV